jgi:hypothetical protein
MASGNWAEAEVMRSLSRPILALVILVAAAPAAADKKFAHSKSLGVSFIAVGDPWCVPHITMRAEAGSAGVFETSEFGNIIRKLGHVLVRECSQASQMSISGTVGDLTLWSGSANKADGWVAATTPQQIEKETLAQGAGSANKADVRLATTTSQQSEVAAPAPAPAPAPASASASASTQGPGGTHTQDAQDSRVVTATHRQKEHAAPAERRLANPLLDRSAQSVNRFAQLVDQCVAGLQQDTLTDIPAPCVSMHPASDQANENMAALEQQLRRGAFSTRELNQAKEILAVYQSALDELSEVERLIEAHNQKLNKQSRERQAILDKYETTLINAERLGQQCIELLSSNLRTYQLDPCYSYSDQFDDVSLAMTNIKGMVNQDELKQRDLDQVKRILKTYRRHGVLMEEFNRLMGLREEKLAEGSEERIKKIQADIGELNQIDLAGKECVKSLTEYDATLIKGCGSFWEAIRKEPPGRYYQLLDEIQKQLDTIPPAQVQEESARVAKVGERINENSRRINSLMDKQKQTPIENIARILDQIDGVGQQCIDGFLQKNDEKIKNCGNFSTAMRERGVFHKTLFVMVVVGQRDDLNSEETAELTRLSEVTKRTKKNWAKVLKIVEIAREQQSAKQ